VGLEENEQAAPVGELAGRGEGRRDLAGMVGVVVENAYAGALPSRLEAAAHAAELGQRRHRLRPVDAGGLEGRERAGRVPAVVLSR
jgi:hypothetical protein